MPLDGPPCLPEIRDREDPPTGRDEGPSSSPREPLRLSLAQELVLFVALLAVLDGRFSCGGSVG